MSAHTISDMSAPPSIGGAQVSPKSASCGIRAVEQREQRNSSNPHRHILSQRASLIEESVHGRADGFSTGDEELEEGPEVQSGLSLWRRWLHMIQKIIALPPVMNPPWQAAAASQQRKSLVDPPPTMMMATTQLSEQGLLSKKCVVPGII